MFLTICLTDEQIVWMAAEASDPLIHIVHNSSGL